ncbi:MAG: cysteine--tRNA ligase [Patescibacteria group bacterium]
MDLKIYNTLSGEKEDFKPLKKGVVGMYQCGPTVYDRAHIGNLRTMVMNDLVRRVFEHQGYKVNQVMNITDVDDKTIKKSQAEKKSLTELTRHYETLFLADIHSLNILTPHHLLRASEHIEKMIEMISIILENDHAYQSKDGIYFSIGLSKNYGALAKLKLDAEVQERIANDEYEKENPRDFALWKFATPEDGDAVWDAPFGKGRPGWHIECSAMATEALGPTIDVHTGGSDLIFPHHTNEIAQSESATGKHFVKYWLHGGFMNVNDAKMSKSKGTGLILSDIEDAGISPLGFRYWLLTSHYRTPVNFTLEAVSGAQNAFIRLVETFVRLGEVTHEHIHAHGEPRDYRAEFKERISDDFDMPGALALTWEMIKDHSLEADKKIKLLLDFDTVFGLGLKAVADMKASGDAGTLIPAEIIALADAREDARKAHEWDKADAFRAQIEEMGYEVKDTDKGPEIKVLR